MPRTPRKQIHKITNNSPIKNELQQQQYEKPTQRIPSTPTTPKRIRPPTAGVSSAPQTPTTPRNVGSLVLLTQQFVTLMKENNGRIDLKEVSEVGQVAALAGEICAV